MKDAARTLYMLWNCGFLILLLLLLCCLTMLCVMKVPWADATSLKSAIGSNLSYKTELFMTRSVEVLFVSQHQMHKGYNLTKTNYSDSAKSKFSSETCNVTRLVLLIHLCIDQKIILQLKKNIIDQKSVVKFWLANKFKRPVDGFSKKPLERHDKITNTGDTFTFAHSRKTLETYLSFRSRES